MTTFYLSMPNIYDPWLLLFLDFLVLGFLVLFLTPYFPDRKVLFLALKSSLLKFLLWYNEKLMSLLAEVPVVPYFLIFFHDYFFHRNGRFFYLWTLFFLSFFFFLGASLRLDLFIQNLSNPVEASWGFLLLICLLTYPFLFYRSLLFLSLRFYGFLYYERPQTLRDSFHVLFMKSNQYNFSFVSRNYVRNRYLPAPGLASGRNFLGWGTLGVTVVVAYVGYQALMENSYTITRQTDLQMVEMGMMSKEEFFRKHPPISNRKAPGV